MTHPFSLHGWWRTS
ncbi:trp operon leader peptide [Cronobacter dublinensis]